MNFHLHSAYCMRQQQHSSLPAFLSLHIQNPMPPFHPIALLMVCECSKVRKKFLIETDVYKNCCQSTSQLHVLKKHVNQSPPPLIACIQKTNVTKASMIYNDFYIVTPLHIYLLKVLSFPHKISRINIVIN